MYQLAGRVVIITGAVGNLGSAVARVLQRLEARTVLVDRSSERLQRAYTELAQSTHHVLVGDVDLARVQSVRRAVQSALDHFGRVDVLVNTVGGFRGGAPVHEQSDETWEFLLDVNLRTTLNACRAVLPSMIGQNSGRIINVASRAALQGEAGLASYCASKAAVMRLTESIASELRTTGITANCILPSILDTPQNRAAMPDADIVNWVRPEAVAEVVAFLASDAASAVTGAAIPCEGRG